MKQYIVDHMKLLDLIDSAFDHFHELDLPVGEAESEAARLALEEFEEPLVFVSWGGMTWTTTEGRSGGGTVEEMGGAEPVAGGCDGGDRCRDCNATGGEG